MLGLLSAPSPCPPSMLPIMLPRPASLNMPCMLLGPIRPPISPPIIRGMPELPGTSLMISKPGSSPALVLRSLERNRRSGGTPPKQSHFCRVANGFFLLSYIIYADSGCFDSSAQKKSGAKHLFNFTRDCSSSSPHLLHCHCRQKDSFYGAWIVFIEYL